MNIRDEHLYHGAVLNQIAEHRQFTAINALKVKGKTSRSAFKVNDGIAVYLKYAGKPGGSYKEYAFTFTKTHLKELDDINKAGDNLHLALVCVKDREICCISYDKFMDLLNRRRSDAGRQESQYVILVTLKPGHAFRANINAAGKRKTYLGKPLLIPRNACPNALFR